MSHGDPVISVVSCFLFFTCFAAGCETTEELTDRPQYTVTTGHVGRSGIILDNAGYFVTVVYREDQTPWLIVVKPSGTDSHFRVKQSGRDLGLTIDGTTFVELPNKTLVVSHKSDPVRQKEHGTFTNHVIMSLRGGFNGMDATTLESIMPEAEDG